MEDDSNNSNTEQQESDTYHDYHPVGSGDLYRVWRGEVIDER
jgi:hypothetical protein